MRQRFSAMLKLLPISLRFQLAFWYTAAFTILLLLTGTIFYVYLERSLEAGVDTELQLRTQQIVSDIPLRNGRIALASRNTTLPQFGTDERLQGDVTQNAYVRLLDIHGTTLASTPAFQQLHVPSVSVMQPLQQRTTWQGTVHDPHDQEIRVCSQVVLIAGRPIAVIQVGESLMALHNLLHQLVASLFVAGFLVLLACAGGSYWLAGRSFAPMRRLAETARKIKARDLQQRVPVPVVRDEVQYLALTLNEMLASLEQSFHQQRRFVADASHELRTPVAVIRNKVEVTLLRARSAEEYCTVLQSIHAETKRLGSLVNDLLVLARADEGQIHFEQETVHLDQLVESVVANAEGIAQEGDISLEIQALQPVVLIGDEARLIQVLMNLLDNAINYNRMGGKVVVSLLKTSSEARFIVQDTGIGIAQEHLPHIFERFYCVDTSRQRSGKSGTGLGLAIVEWIVQKHQGSIAVNSQVGKGTTVTVTLPLT